MPLTALESLNSVERPWAGPTSLARVGSAVLPRAHRSALAEWGMLPDVPALERLYRLGHGETVLSLGSQAPFPALIGRVGFKEETKSSYAWDDWQRGAGEFVAIQYTLSGCGRLHFQDRELLVGPGQALLLKFPNGYRCRIDEGEHWEFFYITLSGPAAIQGITEIVDRCGPVMTPGQASRALERTLDACALALEGKLGSAYDSSELAYAIVMRWLSESAKGRGKGKGTTSMVSVPAFVGPVEQFCHLNLARPIGVEDMARLAKMSRFHFSRQFEKACGVTPGLYLARLRLHKAMQLLTSSDLSLKDIAGLCGFGDANYLCKVFRKKYGASPGRFRARGKRPVAIRK